MDISERKGITTFKKCCRIFDHTVNPKIVLFNEKKLFLVVLWLSLSTHL
jgi:preprotein translocase subunit Sec63